MPLGKKNNNKRNRRKGTQRREYVKANPHMCTEPDFKIGRSELEELDGQQVRFSGEKNIWISPKVDKPVLLCEVVVSGVYVQHVWVDISPEDRVKLQKAPKDCRVYFTGEVGMYASISRDTTSKYGIKNVKLVKEL